MPHIDAYVFSFALSVFLFFGAANLTIEIVISFVLLCKKLKATIKSPFDLESGKLGPLGARQPENNHKGQADLLSQLAALNPAERRAIGSLLKALTTTQSGEVATTTNQDSHAMPAEDLGCLRLPRIDASSSLSN